MEQYKPSKPSEHSPQTLHAHPRPSPATWNLPTPRGRAKQNSHSGTWKTWELIIIYCVLTKYSSKDKSFLLAMSPTDMLRIKEFNYSRDQQLASMWQKIYN